MPEGPKVRLLVHSLRKALLGKKILDFVFTGGKYSDKQPKGYSTFDKAMPLLVKKIDCKGMLLYFIFEDVKGTLYYVMQKLMSGNWDYDDCENCRWFMEVDDNKTLWFNDDNEFTSLKFTKNRLILNKKIKALGPDVLGDQFKLPNFKKIIKTYKTPTITKTVFAFLLDQTIISGCGESLVSEILFDSFISPFRQVSSLDDEDIERLYHSIRIIPRLMFNYLIQGDSIDDHYKIYEKPHANCSTLCTGMLTYWDDSIQI